MADYYPLIARAISGLDASATGEQRRALFEDGLDISRVDVLDAIAREHGVDARGVAEDGPQLGNALLQVGVLRLDLLESSRVPQHRCAEPRLRCRTSLGFRDNDSRYLRRERNPSQTATGTAWAKRKTARGVSIERLRRAQWDAKQATRKPTPDALTPAIETGRRLVCGR